MPLAFDAAITKDDIANLVELKFTYDTDNKGNQIKIGSGKVFLLVGPADEKLVIKTDANISDAGVKSANTVVKAIDKNVKVKVLDAAEKKALVDWVTDWEAEEAWFKKEMGKEYRADEKDAVESLKFSVNYKGPEPWFKMAALELKDLDGALKKRLDGDKSEMKAFIKTLTAKGGLEKLGQVIAADMFNGNTDRFLPVWAFGVGQAGAGKTIGKKHFAFKTLVNLGNVFIASTKAGLEVSALDFVDPGSQFKDITQPLAAAEATAKYPWTGKALSDKKLREAFAADIAADLELVVNPKKSKLSPFTKLGKDAASRLSAGMVTGAQAIKKKLEAKYKAPMAAGIKERYDLMASVK
ncbi:MAG: hypothetical protein ACAI25_03995 [Planctomycetota bacterium]